MPMNDHSPDEFDYTLPNEAIALHPLAQRDQSKLLLYSKGEIGDHRFADLTRILPIGSQLIVNNTKVIHARIVGQKETGGRVEVFLLRPHNLSTESAMLARDVTQWWCLVGGAKRWKSGAVSVQEGGFVLSATRVDRNDDEFLIEFKWNNAAATFSQVLEQVGRIPLPPYIAREAIDEDLYRYQTAFAEREGSVAAPTAGLHFTPELVEKLNVQRINLTLHVSAGTFKPMATERIADHPMHEEYCECTLEAVSALTLEVERYAVGTTSLRTLESLYWLAVKAHSSDAIPQHVDQHEPYRLNSPFESFEMAMQYLQERMQAAKQERIAFSTSIMIAPGYRIQSVRGLFTNFHMPKSTLLLLVCALIGEDWKRVYDHALSGGYRFLSYGDGSLLIP
jgi:S-adenosylmethionine:tRNA ribosyltransferase-isomerase